MPMILNRYPTEEELGRRYFAQWLSMAAFYVTMAHLFENEEWFEQLEGICYLGAMSADGIMDVQFFVEMFYVGVGSYDFELHRIVRGIVSNMI